MKIERFEDLEIWKEAREICKYVFKITGRNFCQDLCFCHQGKDSSGLVSLISYRYDFGEKD